MKLFIVRHILFSDGKRSVPVRNGAYPMFFGGKYLVKKGVFMSPVPIGFFPMQSALESVG
jgi:hypothetical protein